MTEILYRKYYDRHLIIIEGHSGFSIKGEDIVCAAVSCLAFTLLNTISDEVSDDRAKFIRNIVRDGYMCLEVLPFSFGEERVEAIFDTVLTGLCTLSDEYPENVILK